MKKTIKWILFTILGLSLLGGIVFLGIVYSVGDWYAEARAKSRLTTFDNYGFNTEKCAQESVKLGVFVKKLNFVVEVDSLKQYFNEKDTIFYIERGFHEKKRGGTRILSENETNYPYQLIARDINLKDKTIRFRYLEEKNLNIEDSILVNYFPQHIMLKKVQNDTIFLKVFLNKTPQHPNTEKEVGIVKVFSN